MATRRRKIEEPSRFLMILTALFAATAMAACDQEGDDPAGAAQDDESGEGKADKYEDHDAARKPALPITGEWAIVHVKSYTGSGDSREVSEISYELGNANLVGQFNLDSQGFGTISGAKRCSLRAAGGGAVANTSSKPNILEVMQGIVSIVLAVKGIVDGAECAQAGVTQERIVVLAHHDWAGRPSKTLYKNLGVFGEGYKSADAECQSLRGFRIVEFPVNQTIMCIGYADGAATKIRMLVQKKGEIYISRVDLVRPSSAW